MWTKLTYESHIMTQSKYKMIKTYSSCCDTPHWRPKFFFHLGQGNDGLRNSIFCHSRPSFGQVTLSAGHSVNPANSLL